MKHIIVFSICLQAWALIAQPGTLDHNFGGGDGIATQTFLADGHADPASVLIQSDGKIVVVGSTWIPGQSNSEKMAVARFRPDGIKDPTFNGVGKAMISTPNLDLGANTGVLMPDGKILCAGFAESDTEYYCALARLNADGTPDNTFDGDGVVLKNFGAYYQGFNSIHLQPDGKIVVAGYTYSGAYRIALVARFNANGTPDNSFGGGDGYFTQAFGESYSGINSIAVLPNGKILAAGDDVHNNSGDFLLFRLNANGSLDNSFNGDGIASFSFTNQNDRCLRMTVQPDGKILMAGYAGYAVGEDSQIALARLTSNGNLDPFFGGGDGLVYLNITDNSDQASTMLLQPDGKIVLGGSSRGVDDDSQPYHFTVCRFLPDGQIDPSFGTNNGYNVQHICPYGSFIYDMAMLPDGRIIAAGPARYDYNDVFAVACFLTGISVSTSAPGALSEDISLYPNPVQDKTTLEYQLLEAEQVRVDLYDVQGRFIHNLLPIADKSAGRHVETLHLPAGLPSGNYFLKIVSTTDSKTIKLSH